MFGRLGKTKNSEQMSQGRLGLVLALIAFISAPGCVGPRSVEVTRLKYDDAVHETSEQLWLKNIVRLRYGDLPSLLDIAAITSQFELSSHGSYTTGWERQSTRPSNYGTLGMQFRDAPTLSYSPRDPAELTRTMVAPVGITALGLMANNGWNVEDVIRLMIADINGLENAPGAEQLIPERVPPPTPFNEVARLAGQLRHDRLVTLAAVDIPKPISGPIAFDKVNGSDFVDAASHKFEFQPGNAPGQLVLTRTDPGYRLTVSPLALSRPDVDAFRQLLRLAPGQPEYAIHRVDIPGGIHTLPLPDALDTVEVRTRTLLDMLTYLSKGVSVPEEHRCAGIAAQTFGPDGRPFDWPVVTQGLFHVSVSEKCPKDAAVKVRYKGYWFYLPAADKRSKSTLALIQALFNLQLSEPKKGGPLLTLPVGL